MEFLSARSIAEHCRTIERCTTAADSKGMQTNGQPGLLLNKERKPELGSKLQFSAVCSRR
jgi:hypothetical protein